MHLNFPSLSAQHSIFFCTRWPGQLAAWAQGPGLWTWAFHSVLGLRSRWPREARVRPPPLQLCPRGTSPCHAGRCWETRADPPPHPLVVPCSVSRSEPMPCILPPGCAAQRNFCDGTWCQNGALGDRPTPSRTLPKQGLGALTEGRDL